MAEALFWFSAACIFYTYFGYPLLVLLWPRKREVVRRPIHPNISIVVAARDEQARIDGKIEHLLALPYPAERRQIIVVSDGSTDRTAERLQAWAVHTGVQTFHYADHRGKAFALQLGAAHATGEIIVFTDVRQKLHPDSLERLLENFADPEVGCVSGELRFTTEAHPGLKTTVYWKYERWLRRQESLIGSCMGATGAFYGIRRELFRPMPEGLLLDDVYTPLQIALRGWRVVHEPRAVVFDVEAAGERQEFHRKVRTLTGNYQLLQYLPELWSWRAVSLQFFSHKGMRLIVPAWLLIAAVSNCFLAGRFYRTVLLAQGVFYLAAVLGAVFPTKRMSQLAGIPHAFVMLNGAALLATIRFLSGRIPAWKK
ncbi:MAG TPA: glycosyltransferase family 2 protein [Bryobacteraceae bacterium]|nr:glycosyltransferase family 2 protein [Bryobacteraceae bacterium]